MHPRYLYPPPRTSVAPWMLLLVVALQVAGVDVAGYVKQQGGMVLASLLQPPAELTASRRPQRQRPPAAAVPSRAARAGIPHNYRRWYQQAGDAYKVDWRDLAGIGLVESNHGRSHLPGVRSGVNSFGCCAGPMQFNLRNGPPSTWDRYGRGGNPYDPRDAIPAAARLLQANSYGDPEPRPGYRRCPGIKAAPGTINALRHYNDACWYVAQVLAAY